MTGVTHLMYVMRVTCATHLLHILLVTHETHVMRVMYATFRVLNNSKEMYLSFFMHAMLKGKQKKFGWECYRYLFSKARPNNMVFLLFYTGLVATAFPFRRRERRGSSTTCVHSAPSRSGGSRPQSLAPRPSTTRGCSSQRLGCYSQKSAQS